MTNHDLIVLTLTLTAPLDHLKTLRNAAFIFTLKSPSGQRSPIPLIFLAYFCYNTAFQWENAVKVHSKPILILACR